MDNRVSFEKIKTAFLKNKKVTFAVAVAFLGLILILMSEITPSEKNHGEPKDNSTISEQNLEERLTRLLENIDGAGTVEVMITYESTSEQVFAKDIDENSVTNSGNEYKIKSEYIIIKDSGKEGGLLKKELYPKIRGVAVVCDGANDNVIKQQITETISALFDINSTRISVARRLR